MKLFTILLICVSLPLGFITAQEKQQDIKLEVSIYPEEGWMNGGYGSLKFKFTNASGKEIKTGTITGTWHVAGEKYNQWKHSPNLVIADGNQKTGSLISWMPPKTEKLANGKIPLVKGEAIVIIEDKETSIPFSVQVPVAKLPTPLVSKKGKKIELLLQETTWKDLKHDKKMVGYLDDVYDQMYKLTGSQPYKGDMMTLKESPRNPYFAYAGNPIILNTAYVAKSAKSFDNHEVDFGWVHEIGHNFDDVIGHYYNYGTFTEFQANIKLSYVIEKLCTNKTDLKIKSWVDKKTLLTGKAFNDEYFAPKGDDYLKNTERSWKSLSSDEYHALFHTVIRKHGWKVMKDYYRTFGALSKKGIAHPKGIERIFLSFAVLDKCCKENLAELYKQWRIPIDEQKITDISKKYQLETL